MMHGPLRDQNDHSNAAAATGLVAAFERGLAFCNNTIVAIAAVALIAACVILSDSVLGRALFHSPNYWQDEAAVFLLVGATFMTSAYVQGQRGHIGIEAFVGLLSPMVPYPAMARRCRKFPVLRIFCLEILDAGA